MTITSTIPRAIDSNAATEDVANTLKYYPNPVQSVITFDKEYDSVQIQSMDGRLLRNQDTAANQMIIDDLPQGIYIISARSAGEYYTAKMIKN